MQKAYAAYQSTHVRGNLSLARPWFGVHVDVSVEQASWLSHAVAVVGRLAVQDASHPDSNVAVPPSPTSTRPLPWRTCVCLPAPACGRHPATTARTNLRKRPTVISYASRRNELTAAG